MHKILVFPIFVILKLWKDMAPRSSIRGHSLKLYPQRARTQLRKYSFAMRVVNYWNSLPEKIVTSKTLNSMCLALNGAHTELA
jgi:hypothetical protein